MSEISMRIHHCMLYEFQLGKNASAGARHICAALDEGVVANRTCRDWFKRLHEGDMSLKDRRKSGRPLQSNIERIKILIEDNPPFTTPELSIMLGCNQSTIDRHLHDIGKVNKLGIWLSYQLTSDNIQQTITICNFLLSKRHRHRFLQQIITGDEEWLLYIDYTLKRQWINPENLSEPEPKNDLHPKLAMLSIWWDFQEIVYWELLPRNTTIGAKLYCQQFENLKVVLQVNHPERRKVRLLYDNATSHTAKVTRQ